MRYSKEQQEYHIKMIRRVLVMNPNASIREIRETLQKQRKPLKLDKDYIHKLLKKIRKERAYRIDYYTLNKKLAEFEDKISESDLRLWSIVTNKNTTNMEKIAALREIRNNNKELFDKMFDAGVFERQLGKLNVMTRADIIKLIYEQEKNVGRKSNKNSKKSSK